VPLWKLFGEKIREGLPTAWWSGHRTPAGAAKLARDAMARRVKCLKLKSSLTADDPGIAEQIAKACGESFELVIDPNGRWETFDETLRRAEAIRRVNPHAWLEDPIYGNNGAIAEVGRRTGVPVIKTVTNADAVQQVHALGFAGLNLVGPWPALLASSRAAAELNLPYWAGSAVDTGLSDLATVHFGVTQPAFTMAAELAGSHAREHSLLREAIPMRDGVAIPPDGPGLGIEPDLDAIERYRVAEPVVVE
jgi:muconate cycloisomerase